MPEDGNHFVELSVQRRIMQSLVHDASNFFVVHDFSDYPAPQYRPRAGGSTVNRPMFTVKPANDDEEFYAVVERIKEEIEAAQFTVHIEEPVESRIERDRRLNLLYSRWLDTFSNLRNRLPLAVPDASAEDTSPAPSLPHAAAGS